MGVREGVKVSIGLDGGGRKGGRRGHSRWWTRVPALCLGGGGSGRGRKRYGSDTDPICKPIRGSGGKRMVGGLDRVGGHSRLPEFALVRGRFGSESKRVIGL